MPDTLTTLEAALVKAVVADHFAAEDYRKHKSTDYLRQAAEASHKKDAALAAYLAERKRLAAREAVAR